LIVLKVISIFKIIVITRGQQSAILQRKCKAKTRKKIKNETQNGKSTLKINFEKLVIPPAFVVKQREW
jgi:hypothetical protein